MSHYECNDCGRTFTALGYSADDNGDEDYYFCPFSNCGSENYRVVEDKLSKCETLIAVWSDYLAFWGAVLNFTDKQRVSNHLRRLYLLRAFYLKQ